MGWWQDVRFALRLLVKDKWFTLVATIALGLGIGVNATVFTFVNAVLIRGLPFSDPDRLLVVTSIDPVRDRGTGVSYLDFQDLRAASRTFASLAVYGGETMNVSDEGRPPERYVGSLISADSFRVLGASPMLGRDFLPDEDRPGAAPVVMLGSGVWRNRYGSDPGILGRTIRINERPAVIIGVMPDGFRFPNNADLWQPVSALPNLATASRSQRRFEAFGRLAPGASREQAQAELITIGQRLTREYPDTNKDVQPRVQTFNERQNGGPIRAIFLSLMGAVAFVLLIACANVANLLLARSAHRGREIAVRVSIGASRARLIRQLLIESLLLAMAAGVFGFVLASVGVRLFDAATQDVGRPYWIQFTMDGRVFGYLAAVCLGTAVLFGLAPALHMARTDVNEILKEGGRSGAAGIRVRRWSGALVTAELALTLVLLAGAGFMMRNFVTMYRLDLGIDTSRLLTMSMVLPEAMYPALEQRLAFYQQLQDRLGANFQSVAVASHLPLQGGFERQLEIVGRPTASGEELPTVTMLAVDPRYFKTLGIPILQGRGFTDQDGRPGQDAAVVNARFAQVHFAGDDPIGRQIVVRLDVRGGDPPPGTPLAQTATIVGVVPNVRQRDFDEREPDPVAYLPFRASPRAFMSLIARAEGDPQGLTPQLREEMRMLDADLPLFDIRTMDETLARIRWPFRVFGTMFAIFALIALILSAVGLYAVTAYSVTQRTQEIGVRTALGAQSPQVMWLFLRRALVHLGIGLALGIAGAVGVGKIFESAELLVQVDGGDPLTIGAIALLLIAVSLTASLWPARRATRLDPVAALRGE